MAFACCFPRSQQHPRVRTFARLSTTPGRHQKHADEARRDLSWSDGTRRTMHPITQTSIPLPPKPHIDCVDRCNPGVDVVVLRCVDPRWLEPNLGCPRRGANVPCTRRSAREEEKGGIRRMGGGEGGEERRGEKRASCGGDGWQQWWLVTTISLISPLRLLCLSSVRALPSISNHVLAFPSVSVPLLCICVAVCVRVRPCLPVPSLCPGEIRVRVSYLCCPGLGACVC